MITNKWLKANGFVKKDNYWELHIQQFGGYSYFIRCQPKDNRMWMQYEPKGWPAVPNTIELYDCTNSARLVSAAKLLGYKFNKED